MIFPFSQANIRADKITPTITAVARSLNMVIKVTAKTTITSDLGIFPPYFKLSQLTQPQ
jgi:hypothetical protein